MNCCARIVSCSIPACITSTGRVVAKLVGHGVIAAEVGADVRSAIEVFRRLGLDNGVVASAQKSKDVGAVGGCHGGGDEIAEIVYEADDHPPQARFAGILDTVGVGIDKHVA